jgi:hypothetical protein
VAEIDNSNLKAKEETGSNNSSMKMMDISQISEENASMSMEEETEKMSVLLCGEDTTTTTRSGTSNTQMKFLVEMVLSQTSHSDFFQR